MFHSGDVWAVLVLQAGNNFFAINHRFTIRFSMFHRGDQENHVMGPMWGVSVLTKIAIDPKS